MHTSRIVPVPTFVSRRTYIYLSPYLSARHCIIQHTYMMGLRDLIKKKDRLGEGDARYSETLNTLAGPEFTFIRSDTNTHEIIYPPNHPRSEKGDRYLSAHEPGSSPSKSRRSLDVFRTRSRGNSLLSASGDSDGDSGSISNGATRKEHRRLSHRLGLARPPKTSEFVPEDLPQINVTSTPDAYDPTTAAETKEAREAREQQWEKRATILATTNEERQRSRSRSMSATPSISYSNFGDLNSDGGGGGIDTSPPKTLGGVVSSKEIDQDIQEAIRLHEEGDLERSTQLFGRLADPYGANNPLSQVLYGLALRLVSSHIRTAHIMFCTHLAGHRPCSPTEPDSGTREERAGDHSKAMRLQENRHGF